MKTQYSYQNQFLIAMPCLMDSVFSQTLTYICAHDPQGAMGVIINRPLNLKLGDILRSIQTVNLQPNPSWDLPLYFGGPVNPESGFVLHQPMAQQWKASTPLSKELTLTTSEDIINAMAEGKGPERVILSLGFANWGAGQLEQEIAENSWLTSACDTHIMFDIAPKNRWQAAVHLLGVHDLYALSDQVGHA